jgi:Zn finger protein HypA/HybF involved in hydrogenase expression
MKQRDLKRLLDMGLSYRDIAHRTGQSKSNVRYWASKFGLQSKGAKTIARPQPAKDVVAQAVRANTTMAGTLRSLDRSVNGGNRESLTRKIEDWGLDTSHWTGHRLGCSQPENRARRKPLELVMVENSTYSRGALKKRLIEDKVLEEQCAECEIPPAWNGKRLVLVLDHINGVNNDHRLENLRLLCPNCNSQTPTFAGRNVSK